MLLSMLDLFTSSLIESLYPSLWDLRVSCSSDKCICVRVIFQGGPDERSVPGNTIAVQADMPFSGLTRFGQAFLNKFECSQMPHPV